MTGANPSFLSRPRGWQRQVGPYVPLVLDIVQATTHRYHRLAVACIIVSQHLEGQITFCYLTIIRRGNLSKQGVNINIATPRRVQRHGHCEKRKNQEEHNSRRLPLSAQIIRDVWVRRGALAHVGFVPTCWRVDQSIVHFGLDLFLAEAQGRPGRTTDG